MADASNLNVLIICGSLRKGSFNAMVANTLPSLAPAGMKIARSPTIEMPLYNADVQNEQGFPAPATALADAVRAADGLVIVTPEYNYSLPGVLKNAIDWVSRPLSETAFKGKPVAAMGAATGNFGTVRAQVELRQILVSVGAYQLVKPELLVYSAAGRFDETGRLIDESTRLLLAELIEALVAWARQLTQRHRS